jgi:nitrite reductase (NADH) small subunit/3-phenylpropionate/trans-cinnamate dioxygenase ferredoxin subunit
MAFTKAATVQDVPPGKSKQIAVNGKVLALFNVNGTYYAVDDTCPHRGGPLSEGELAGTVVTCPWHGATFDVATGAHLSPPAPQDVASYKVQVVGEEVQVDVG